MNLQMECGSSSGSGRCPLCERPVWTGTYVQRYDEASLQYMEALRAFYEPSTSILRRRINMFKFLNGFAISLAIASMLLSGAVIVSTLLKALA